VPQRLRFDRGAKGAQQVITTLGTSQKSACFHYSEPSRNLESAGLDFCLPNMDRLLPDSLYNLIDRLFFSSLGRSLLLCSALYYIYVAFKKHRDYQVEWGFDRGIRSCS